MIPGDLRADAQLLWDFQRMGHAPRACSVVVGLGSHDLGVADVAVSLYRGGFAPLLVFTGATSATTRERMPRGEAVHYRERALALGVPGDVVLVETRARNTGENLRFSRELLTARGVDVTSVLLVSKPYEERRAYATALCAWPGVDVVCTSSPLALDAYAEEIGDVRLVLDMLVGAVQRLIVYPARGFMAEQDVPPAVADAYRRLRDRGFTGRLVPESV
ncbi:YdcF family protein [Streptomyces sp. NPDC101490]|uniref:YdcF family protein n=1 Tax=Streptomyces sp. NPDC101490 TaxID=3366143 RepID=UPI0038089792